jgi:hypothetical protein
MKFEKTYPYSMLIRTWSVREREIIIGMVIKNAMMIFCTNKKVSVNMACHIAVKQVFEISNYLSEEINQDEFFEYIYTQCVMDRANGAYHLNDWKLKRAEYFGDQDLINNKEAYSEILSQINETNNVAERTKLWSKLHDMREGFAKRLTIEATSDAIYKTEIAKRAS